MARQLTKILIITANKKNAEKYKSFLKKSKSIKPEIKIENSIKNLIIDLNESIFDFLIFDMDGLNDEINLIVDFLSRLDDKTPCMIIADRNLKTFFEKIINQNFLFNVIPDDWVDREFFEATIQRMLRLQKKRKEINELYRANESLLKKIPGMVFRRKDDKQGTVKYVSDGCMDLTGYTSADLIDNHFVSYFDLIYPDDRETVRDSIKYQIEKNEQYQITYRILDAQGRLKWVWESGNVFQALDSGKWFIEGFIMDISEHMMTMEKLQKNQNQLQNIYDHVSVGLGIVQKRIFVEVNDFFCELFGYQRSEIIGHSTSTLSFHPTEEDFNLIGRENAENLEKESYCSNYTKLKRKDGKELDVLLTVSRIIKDDKDSPVTFAILDITKQTESKRLLEESEEKNRGIIRHMNEGVFLADENGIVVEWSDAMEKLIAIPKDEVLGVSFYQLIDRLAEMAIIKIDIEKGKQFLKGIIEDSTQSRFDKTWEGEMLTPQGDYRYFQTELFTINTPNGNRLAAIVRDIDDQKRRERELQSLVNLASVIRKFSNDVTSIRQSVSDILMSLLGLDCIAIAAFQGNNDLGSIVEIRGNFDDKIGETVSWKNCVNQRPLYNDSVYEMSESCLEQFYGLEKPSEIPMTRISIPLVNGNNRIGIVFLFHKKAFSEHEYRLLDALATIFASALSQALLFERTELRLKRLESLHVIDQAISGLFNLDLTNRIILDQAKQQLGADGGDILILNMATNMMEYSANFGFDQLDLDEKRVHLSRSMAGQVLLTREPCIVPDIGKTELPFIMKHLQRHGFNAYFSYPLVAKGEPKGVIEIYMQNPFHPDTEWLNFLRSLATHSSIAIDNIQLFEKMQSIQYD